MNFESPLPAAQVDLAETFQIPEWVLSGGVTSTSARVKAKLLSDSSVSRLIVSTTPDFGYALFSEPDTALIGVNNKVVDHTIDGLIPNMYYFYALEVDGVAQLGKIGNFKTFPAGASSFSFALASCARTASAHPVFLTIRNLQPLFFFHLGDFHYENIAQNNQSLFEQAYDRVLASTTQSQLYQSLSIAYMWDDHDYGPNNSDSTAPGRAASRAAYQEYIPHYPLAAGSGNVPIYQAFTVGRARFVVCDSRSARSPASAPDNAAKTMLGATQKEWFKQELVAADGVYPLIVWVNTLPWIGSSGDDGWYLYTTERRELADFIKNNQISGLCMISGDAHMLAIDDGSHSDYATGGGAPFPVMHAAALDQSGSIKGGPYSHGAYPGGGQFGLMTVIDSGGTNITVQWSGRNANNQEIVAYSFGVPASAVPQDVLGDVDGDGVPSLADVIVLINYIFDDTTIPQSRHPQSDVTCDGIVNISDAIKLIHSILHAAPLQCP